ncbi:MAG TPA: Crp/Fnr family transcriptional regulator [Planctomycetaceae bacterium]|nr:Crp/Fnr family transcriptional regulator [Planctomycetaceae bacterium]
MQTTDHPQNRLLGQLPAEAYESLAPRMQRIEVRAGEIIVEQGAELRHACFPSSAVFSLLLIMSDGSTAETSTIGAEGMLGVQLLAGVVESPQRVLAQVSGEAWQMPAAALRDCARQTPELRAVLVRYAVAFLQQVHQNAACNRLHSLEQRMARWLLATRDHVGRNEFAITQNVLADMLGVHRPTVSNTAAVFKQAGAISYRRGRMSILDHRALRDASCECYGVIKGIYDALLRRTTA